MPLAAAWNSEGSKYGTLYCRSSIDHHHDANEDESFLVGHTHVVTGLCLSRSVELSLGFFFFVVVVDDDRHPRGRFGDNND
eukprot:scaffold2656_cov117-Amphora_coffeaeformis.AAC.1